MIEIIALFFLCRTNGRLAIKKGLPEKRWWLKTVIAWIVAEFIGVILGISLFGTANLYAVLGTGLFSAFGGYLFIRNLLEKMPDGMEDDINRIGVDDLRPPKI
jgi:hypothetical protein